MGFVDVSSELFVEMLKGFANTDEPQKLKKRTRCKACHGTGFVKVECGAIVKFPVCSECQK